MTTPALEFGGDDFSNLLPPTTTIASMVVDNKCRVCGGKAKLSRRFCSMSHKNRWDYYKRCEKVVGVSMHHQFGPDLMCGGCGSSWEEQQVSPHVCGADFEIPEYVTMAVREFFAFGHRFGAKRRCLNEGCGAPGIGGAEWVYVRESGMVCEGDAG